MPLNFHPSFQQRDSMPMPQAGSILLQIELIIGTLDRKFKLLFGIDLIAIFLNNSYR